jgi:hypothetical protein
MIGRFGDEAFCLLSPAKFGRTATPALIAGPLGAIPCQNECLSYTLLLLWERPFITERNSRNGRWHFNRSERASQIAGGAPYRSMRRQNMISSDEAFRALLGWKEVRTVLCVELVSSAVPVERLPTARISGLTESVLTVDFGSHEKSFSLSGAEIVLGEKVPYRFRNLFTKGVRVSTFDGGLVLLMEPCKESSI